MGVIGVCAPKFIGVLGCWVTLLIGLSHANPVLAEQQTKAVANLGDAPAGVISRVVTGPAQAGIYRSIGPNGEVSFNNFGDGERITLDVRAAPGGEPERSAARTDDMLAMAQLLAADRQARATQRNAARTARAAVARANARAAQRTDAYATNRQRFFPGFLPRRGGVLAQPGRRGAGPYRDGYRFSGPSHRAQPGHQAAAPKNSSPVTKRHL